jgi:hypothetical protein
LRFEGYAPLAAGAAALSSHIYDVRPCHNLKSVADLAAALAGKDSRRPADSSILRA